MELCYRNNTKSLFRKYARFVTWFANTGIGRDYLLHNNLYLPKNVSVLLPNGYIEHDGKHARLTVTTRPVYASKIYPALQALESFTGTMRETKELLLWYLGLRYQPSWAKSFNATLTVNPDANPETTTVDGYADQNTAQSSFATLRGGSGNVASDTAGANQTFIVIQNTAPDTTNQWTVIRRAFTLFDTSAIGAGTITPGGNTISAYITATGNDFSQSADVCLTAPASNTALVNSDYANVTFTRQATGIGISSLTTSAYNDFTLNGTGESNIQTSGVTKFGFLCSGDMDNTAPSWGAPTKQSYFNGNFSDAGSNKPKLTIIYTPAPATGGGSFLLNFV